jgi:dTDP-4-dehydrorhamnose reductase
MKIGIFGSTGLVGNYLVESFPTDYVFNSKNSEQIANQEFDLLFVSAMPAVKWFANKNPEVDEGILKAICATLETVQARRVVLISTVDVFPKPLNVYESTKPEADVVNIYGSNRLRLEDFLVTRFESVWVVRLPGLVGKGLKKNLIYDIRFKQDTASVPINARYQFYPLNRLGKDLAVVLAAEPGVYHFAVEPLSVAEIADSLSIETGLFSEAQESAANYDFRTEKAHHWGLANLPYLVSKAESMSEIKAYFYGT